MGAPFRAGVATVVAALVTVLPATAVAAPSGAQGRAALLPVELEGDFNEGWRERLQRNLSDGMTQAGMEVIGPGIVAQRAGSTQCADPACFQSVAKAIEARFLVRSQIAVDQRNYEVRLEIIDGRDGTVVASSVEGCQLCGLAEVGDLVTAQAAGLRKKMDGLSLAPAVLAIASDPAGAEIWVDGERIGVAPLEFEVEAGSHEAVARKQGFVDQQVELEAVQGVRERVQFELLTTPAAGPLATGAGPCPTRAVPVAPFGWSALGLGTAGLAAGVTFLVIDDGPYQARCSGPDVDALGNCRQRYNTLPHGIALATAGGAFVVVGAALLIAARLRRGRRDDTVARRLQLGPGMLGGRF
ncbi:MAG: PEGA domain-containing protein [Deltaproteobacteria bacterium]|nr:PEGA domain-containing protein [Deltaproteobacteria bacterium]